jgi:hypothetical protein
MACGPRHGHAFDVYARRICPRLERPADVQAYAGRHGAFWLFADDRFRAALDSAGVRYTEEARFGHFQVTLLKPAFLNPATREASLEPRYWLRVSPEKGN